MAASLATSGTSKSGSPIDRLIGSFIFAARSKTLRMPEASTPSARCEMYSEAERMDEQCEARRHEVEETRRHFTRACVPWCLRAFFDLLLALGSGCTLGGGSGGALRGG